MIPENLRNIIAQIKAAQAHSPLADAGVELIGACKGQAAEALIPYLEAGLYAYGENRVQEAAEKWPELLARYPQARLHLIGPLQTNKVREAVKLFHVIETVDREALVEAIAREQGSGVRCQEFFIQINTGEEPQKAGVSPAGAGALIAYAREKGLNVTGLMCVPPADQPPAPHFALVRQLGQEHGLEKLSMGMSGDFKEAVRMGATHVRIGTALFGERG